MQAEHRTTQPTLPRLDPNGWRWWVATGLMGLVSVALGGFGATVLGFESVDAWFAWTPLVLAGLVTGAVGGVRRWWLLVPTAMAPLAWFGVVSGEGEVYPCISGLGYWSLVIGVTAVVTVVAIWLLRRFAH